MLKPFSLKLGEADAAVLFDIFNLIITNGYYCNNLGLGALFWVDLFLPAVYLPSVSNMRVARCFGWQKQAFSYDKAR